MEKVTFELESISFFLSDTSCLMSFFLEILQLEAGQKGIRVSAERNSDEILDRSYNFGHSRQVG